MSNDRVKSARSHASRHHTRLKTKLDGDLIAYAATAGAAGVSMLALAQPAEARIVYTPTHQRITGHTLLDLNNDGTNDFEFTNHISTRIGIHETFTVNSYGNLQVYGLNASNQVWGQGTIASRLAPGISVGSTGQFPGGKEMGGFVGTDGRPHTYFAPWLSGGGVRQGYLGFKFVVNGETHFGWARIKVEVTIDPTKLKAVMTGYAYETVPNQAIVTGQTSSTSSTSAESSASGSLGRLAIGAAGKPH